MDSPLPPLDDPTIRQDADEVIRQVLAPYPNEPKTLRRTDDHN